MKLYNVPRNSMNKQPEALQFAAELRHLHEVNAELLFALKNLLNAKNGVNAIFMYSDEIARAAITKAEGGAA